MPYEPLGVDRIPATMKYQCADRLRELPLAEALAMLQLDRLTNTFWLDTVSPTWGAIAASNLQRLIDQSFAMGQKMAITDMPDGLGYEVVAIDAIARGAQILYCGELLQQAPDNDYYLLTLPPTGAYRYVSARQISNITRLFAHASSEANLQKNVAFHEATTQSQVALPNFALKVIALAGFHFSVLTAMRDIQAGDRLRWDYGLQHFIGAGITPVLFDQNTHQPMDPAGYHWRSTAVSFVCENGQCVKQDSSIQEIIAQDGYCVIPGSRSEKPYDTYINAQFFKDLLIREPTLTHRLMLELPLPLNEHPYIKRFAPDRKLGEVISATLKSLLQEVFVEAGWKKAVFNEPDRPHEKNTCWYNESLTAKSTEMAQRLSEQGLLAETDFFMVDAEFYISDAALFKASVSVAVYYAEAALSEGNATPNNGAISDAMSALQMPVESAGRIETEGGLVLSMKSERERCV